MGNLDPARIDARSMSLQNGMVIHTLFLCLTMVLACLMVTDVATSRSRLVCDGEPRVLAALPFPRLGPGEWDIENMVSRKKQLVPALQGTMEAIA